MDRIDCFRAFVRALEGGSFSAAAKELGIGQPAVSKRIALLESEFGTQLFLRTTRQVSLSAAGRERLTEMLGPAVAAAVASTATAADDRGWVTAVVPIESAEHAHAEFLRLGAEIEVLAPADLRDRMRRTARSLGELYRVAQRPREAEQAPG